MSLSSDSRSSLEELKRCNPPAEAQTAEPTTQTESVPAPEMHPTGPELQELLQILWTMGEVLGEQTVILEELSQHMDSLRTVSWETRDLLKREQTDTSAIRLLLEQEQQNKEQAGKKRERRFSFRIPRISLPRPSPGWLFLPLILAALWALWYSWGALWSALSPMFT